LYVPPVNRSARRDRDKLCVSSTTTTSFGVFPDDTWRRLIDDSALERVESTTPLQTSTWCSLVGVPPAEKSRRQIEAG
jgi:hypothetical protein